MIAELAGVPRGGTPQCFVEPRPASRAQPEASASIARLGGVDATDPTVPQGFVEPRRRDAGGAAVHASAIAGRLGGVSDPSSPQEHTLPRPNRDRRVGAAGGGLAVLAGVHDADTPQHHNPPRPQHLGGGSARPTAEGGGATLRALGSHPGSPNATGGGSLAPLRSPYRAIYHPRSQLGESTASECLVPATGLGQFTNGRWAGAESPLGGVRAAASSLPPTLDALHGAPEMWESGVVPGHHHSVAQDHPKFAKRPGNPRASEESSETTDLGSSDTASPRRGTPPVDVIRAQQARMESSAESWQQNRPKHLATRAQRKWDLQTWVGESPNAISLARGDRSSLAPPGPLLQDDEEGD